MTSPVCLAPRLGYFGAVDPWLIDQELIRYVSAKRPDWQWVLVGLRASPLDIESLPNVHYLGSKPYSCDAAVGCCIRCMRAAVGD